MFSESFLRDQKGQGKEHLSDVVGIAISERVEYEEAEGHMERRRSSLEHHDAFCLITSSGC